MSLHPLSNFVAVFEPDPAARLALEEGMRGEYPIVHRPVEGWVCGGRPLPGAQAGAHVRAAGLVFAEGADLVASDAASTVATARLAREAPERLATLPGDFGFLALGERGEAVAVRSCGGLAPLYVHAGAQRVVVGTRLHEVAARTGLAPVLDPLPTAAWTTIGAFPNRRTFIKGISIVDRGGYARVRPGSPVAFAPYWDPRPDRLPRPSRAVVAEHQAQLREMLLAALDRDLDPDGVNLLTLSGGVDSSSLGALAAGSLGRRVATLSFVPRDAQARAHEESYIRGLNEECRFERQIVMPLSLRDRLNLFARAERFPFPVVHPALLALPEVDPLPTVLFGGEMADEVCGSDMTIPDWIEQTGAIALLLRWRRLPGGIRVVRSWIRGRARMLTRRPAQDHRIARSLPESVHADVRAEFDEWLLGARQAFAADRGRPGRYLAARLAEDAFLAMNWEATSALGVRRSFPFCRRETIELASACHPDELVGPGTKRLLRGALAGDVPRRTLERADKGRWPDEEPLAWQPQGTVPSVLTGVLADDGEGTSAVLLRTSLEAYARSIPTMTVPSEGSDFLRPPSRISEGPRV